MLSRLHINNFALIDELELDFRSGLTAITGETGSGKSILLGALSLLLGNRADSGLISAGSRKCIIEGTVNIDGFGLEELLIKNDLDYESLTTIRREVFFDGKSRAFINDTPVNLAFLKEFGSRLIDIHSQHETITLNNASFQLSVVDGLAGNGELLKTYRLLYNSRKEILQNLEALRAEQIRTDAESDYFQFLFDELQGADLREGELESLEEEILLLTNATDIKSAISNAVLLLGGDDMNPVMAINSALQNLNQITSQFREITLLIDRLKSVNIELKDLISELETAGEKVALDPDRLQLVSDRLDLIYRLQKKHKVQSVHAMIALMNDIESKVVRAGSLDDQIKNLEKKLASHEADLKNIAAKISKARNDSIPKIKESLIRMLHSLGMKNAEVIILSKQTENGSLGPNGTDEVEFLFTANAGVAPKSLNKVASGGELSRLMLCIKSLVANQKGLQTLVFDEIDTGVSGEVAHRIGTMIRKMAAERQVLIITHLPQSAALAQDHFKVSKQETNGKTQTSVVRLSEYERVEEIAKMLSGEHLTDAALANARVLLQN